MEQAVRKSVKENKAEHPFNMVQVTYFQNVLREMFADADNSYVGIMCGGKSRTVSVGDLLEHYQWWYCKNSCYMTGNLIWPDKRRCQKNVCVLNDIYIDLDTNHDEGSRFVSPVQAYEEVLDIVREKELPYPSLIVNTTRGLQLHWFLERVATTKNRIVLWKRIETALCGVFADFYPDTTVATDESRLLRIPYSINTKSGCMAEILDFNKERYSLRDFKEALFDNAPTKSQLDYIARIEEALGVTFPDNYKNTKENASTTIKLNKKEFLQKIGRDEKESPVSEKQQELIGSICGTLGIRNPGSRTYRTADKFIRSHMPAYRTAKQNMGARLANREKTNAEVMEAFVKAHPQNDHCRETLLFLYRLAQMHVLGDEDKAWEKTAQLNKVYDSPFNERKLERLTHSAVNYFVYEPERQYCTKAIVNKVGSDIASFFTRPCKGKSKGESKTDKKAEKEKKQKQKAYNKKYYESKREGESKADKIAKRREAVKELMADGKSYPEIGRILNVCTKTIQRDVESFKDFVNVVDVNADVDEVINVEKTVKREEIEGGVDIFSRTPLLYNTVGIKEVDTAEEKPVSVGDVHYTQAHLARAFQMLSNRLHHNPSYFVDQNQSTALLNALRTATLISEGVDVYDKTLLCTSDYGNRIDSAPSVGSVGKVIIDFVTVGHGDLSDLFTSITSLVMA